MDLYYLIKKYSRIHINLFWTTQKTKTFYLRADGTVKTLDFTKQEKGVKVRVVGLGDREYQNIAVESCAVLAYPIFNRYKSFRPHVEYSDYSICNFEG